MALLRHAERDLPHSPLKGGLLPAVGRAGAAAVILAAVLAPWGSGSPADGFFFVQQVGLRAAPVVVVVLDELPTVSLMDRRGRIDESLFPGFARLARSSTWYRNATTSETFTKEALPALLTGTYPFRELGRSFDYPRNLFSLLGDRYEIRAANVRPGLCPPDLCDVPIGTAPVPRFQSFGRGEKGALLFSFLRHLEPPDRPRLHFLHLVFPHGPWRYLPSGRRYDEVDPMPGEVDEHGRGTSWVKDGWLVEQAYQRHLLQTRLADRLIDALIVKLKRTGLWNEAVVVVTADHGLGWEPGEPKRLPVEETVPTLAGVPLFVKAPGQRIGAVSDVPAQSVDVLPTIADLLGATTWPDLDGRSLEGRVPRDRERMVVEVPVTELRKELRRAARAKYDLLAPGAQSIDLWRAAPGATDDLVGRDVGELPIAPAAGATAHAPAVEELIGADPDGPWFPSLFEGTLEGTPPGKRPLVAVAVDGRIAAVTRSYESHGLQWFGAILRPGAFGDAEEDVDLYLVDADDRRGLVRLPLR